MADTTITPNMNLPVPVPSVAPGPAWATSVVACFSAVDSHNHTSGQGVPITPAAINVNTDLPLNGNSLTSVQGVTFTSQSVPSSAPGTLTEVAVDLYYTDGAGNQIRITQGGSVAGSTGTITGLPSGTASASYSAGTFTFQSATNTPATMAVGPLVIGRTASGTKTVSITPSSSQAANYDLTLPIALPAESSVVTLDASGNLGTSVPSGTYTPTLTNVTGTTTVTASTFSYMRVGTRVQVNGYVSGTLGAAGTATFQLTLPIDPTANFSTAFQVVGGLFFDALDAPTRNYARSVSGAKKASLTLQAGSSSGVAFTAAVSFNYDCA